jgi:transcriptional regulator with XRE-family HTH domain
MRLPNIEAERIKHGISKEEFSQYLGVSKRTVNNWQNGRTEIPISKLIAIANMWSCSTDYLLGLTTEDKSA